MLTEDGPVGLAARLRRRTFALAAWFLAFVGLGGVASAILLQERRVTLMQDTGKVRGPIP